MSSKPIQFDCIYIHIISTISSSAFSKTLVSGGPMPRLICCGFAHLCPGSRTLQSSPPPAWIRISSFSHHRPHLLLLLLLQQRVCGLVTAPERRVWAFRSRIGRLGLRDSKLCSAVTHKNMVEMKPPGGPIFRIPWREWCQEAPTHPWNHHDACAISGVGCGRCWRGQGDEAWGKRRRRNPSSWSSPHRPRTYSPAPWHNPSSSSTNQRSGQRHLSWACGGGSRSSKQRMEQPERATEERMEKEDKS